MADRSIEVTHHGDVALVQINNPPVNALSLATLDHLAETLGKLRSERPGALVVFGGERIFAAGADIGELADPSRRSHVADGFARAFDALAEVRCLSVAAIGGAALGGGCELALACDFRIASERARLGQPEIQLGLLPGAGGTQRLVRLIGLGHARDLVLTGRQVNAEEAARIGLVDRVLPPEALLVGALAFGAELAAGPRRAQLAAKHALELGLDGPLSVGLARERALFNEILETNDAVHGIASFLEKGPGHAAFMGD